MLSAIVSPIRRIITALVASNSPHELAVGFTLGLIIGLVPKGNLIALSLFVMLFSLRCNKGISLVAAVLFSFAAAWTDPVAHQIGTFILNIESIQANYASVLQFPLGPWLGFNNTVVSGSLLMGLYSAYPAYWITRIFCGAFRRRTTQ
jgi:uncharacterized protein (TIGR03546 family)